MSSTRDVPTIVAPPDRPPAKTRIPFFTQAATFRELWPRIRANLTDVIARGKYSHGQQVAQLESALADWTGARHVIAVNSGTDALVLLLRAAGLRPGDEVVVPAYSFIATATAVTLARGRPVFADIDPESYALHPDAAAAAITPRTRMLLPAHLFHRLADVAALADLAHDRGLTLVEDSAEAIGMRLGGRHAGLFGAGGVLSFFPSKTLGAIGDAGAVLTDDPAVATTADALRHHGRSGRTLDNFPGINNPTVVPGVNSKMDDIQAAVLLAKLGRLPLDIARRAELAAAYTERLRDVPGVLRLPRQGSVYYVYLVEVARRDELARHLVGHGIDTEVYYPTPLHLQPCFAELGHRRGDFPHAEAACERALALPLYPDLPDAAVDRVCDAIRGFYTGSPS